MPKKHCTIQWTSVRNMVINYPNYLFTFTLIFYSIIKNISLFLGYRICLETVLQLFTNLHII